MMMSSVQQSPAPSNHITKRVNITIQNQNRLSGGEVDRDKNAGGHGMHAAESAPGPTPELSLSFPPIGSPSLTRANQPRVTHPCPTYAAPRKISRSLAGLSPGGSWPHPIR
ncbi:unnamed protein product [Prunus brigantina]